MDLNSLKVTAEWLRDHRNDSQSPSPSVKIRHREGLVWNVPGFSEHVVLDLIDRLEKAEGPVFRTSQY